ARLGISVQNVGSGQQSQGAIVEDGAQISDVSNGSAAQSAGLRNGDVITKIDETLITDADSLVATIRSYRPGDQVTVTYTRDGDQKTITLKLDSDASTTNSCPCFPPFQGSGPHRQEPAPLDRASGRRLLSIL